jgi:hypothetical protein
MQVKLMEATMENVMTMDRWNALSDADRVLLKSLGIEPQVVHARVKKVVNPLTLERRLCTRNTAPAEYYAQIQSTCGCCRTKTVKEGKMGHRKLSDNYLSFLETEIPAGEVFKLLKVVSITCHSCETELDKLTKEELISMVMTLRSAAAKKCTL